MFKREVKRLTVNDCFVGMIVTSRYDLTDWGGEPFFTGEAGTIVKLTYNTVHVQDPRGHVHKRGASDFIRPHDREASERDRERNIADIRELAGIDEPEPVRVVEEATTRCAPCAAARMK